MRADNAEESNDGVGEDEVKKEDLNTSVLSVAESEDE